MLEKSIDWHVPMWGREKPRRLWDPSRRLIKTLRDYERYGGYPPFVRFSLRKVCVIRHRFWTVVTGAELHLGTKIGGGFQMNHPNGVVIHPMSIIGVNCLMFQQVTLAGQVTLGDHVDIGAGAKILGPITIGSNVQVGANAVVTKDVPNGSTVMGVPARITSRKEWW